MKSLDYTHLLTARQRQELRRLRRSKLQHGQRLLSDEEKITKGLDRLWNHLVELSEKTKVNGRFNREDK